jgi:hypothetical protein
MGYISQDELVQNMTPEQRILVSNFYSRFDIGSGVPHHKITNVEPFAYMGAIIGSEFVVYSLEKLYLCLSLIVDSSGVANAVVPQLTLQDELNNSFFILSNVNNTVNATGVWFNIANTLEVTNKWFSCFVTTVGASYINCRFIGYRMTIF